MVEPSYEYWGLMAQAWDLLRGDTSQWADRFFFLELIAREGQPVLDVGCGGGRLLLDYAKQGIDIDGVDISPELLELARHKTVARGLVPRLYLQPMQALELPRRYQVILVPSSSFQLVTDPGEARQALRRLYDHLLPGGVLAMPFMDFWRPGDALDSGMELVAEQLRPEDSLTVRRWSRSIFDPVTQCESTEDRFEVLMDGAVLKSELHQRAPATRLYTQVQALRLFVGAGFTDTQAWHEFSWEPAQPDDRLITLVGRRAA